MRMRMTTRMRMRTRTTLLSVLTCFAALSLCFAADNPNLGTWKLNEAKSKFSAGMSRNVTVVYAMDGDNIKATIDGVDGKGSPLHSVWVGKFDGKDYPVTGDPISDMRALKQVNAHTLDITSKKDGKVTVTGKVVVAADGKSRTVTTTVTDSAGKKMHSTWVYDKQ
jgi:outer membrane protein assembly factor BamE (lipoprotein component of BamABCDE complex)